MLKVPNRGCIFKLGIRTLAASKKRNCIAVLAIALTTLLFTALFTITMSINESYEAYQFRQVGGYSHGSFKDVSDEQIAEITAHPSVREAGVRRVFGVVRDGGFAKEVQAELSFMDDNCAKWSYAVPTTGRAPASGKEIATDTRALALLGVEPVLGTHVTLTYEPVDSAEGVGRTTDTFILVGFWEYDPLIPAHFLNVSEEYAISALMDQGVTRPRAELNVMLRSSVDIYGQMLRIDEELGYDAQSRDSENSARIGVNWGYSTAQLGSSLDIETIASIVALLVLVILTGFLIIHNIFRISIAGDIRAYGLLKTIGVTPRQIRRIVRIQALALCVPGIPAGLLVGYIVGAALTPVAISKTALQSAQDVRSVSPWIFILSAAFAAVTVLLSCQKPARMAARVSPVEAVHFAQSTAGKPVFFQVKRRGLSDMAMANLGRNRLQTVMVLLSLALSVVLLQLLLSFVNGFDMDKYLARLSGADFIVSSPEYFRYDRRMKEAFTDEMVERLDALGEQASVAGYAWKKDCAAGIWMGEEDYLSGVARFAGEDEARAALLPLERRGELVRGTAEIEAFDPVLFGKLDVVEGNVTPLADPSGHMIAVVMEVDDYGHVIGKERYPAVGEQVVLTYAEDAIYIDSRTGEPADVTTPAEYFKEKYFNEKDVTYTVCAQVTVPYSLGMRYYVPGGCTLVMSAEALGRDSGSDPVKMLWIADAPDRETEEEIERELASWTASEDGIMYESKETERSDFSGFRRMFLLMGGVLCGVVALVGALNLINAVMTGIIERQYEFAVLQAVGMTGRQLIRLLVLEGVYQTMGAVVLSLILTLVFHPLVGGLMERVFWFFSSSFSLTAVLAAAPVFLLLGCLTPIVLYRGMADRSIVERLRMTER